jgi:NAD(P)-dependent dehydrogenase (short-subunit alcohol dehydrogenase family)
MKMSCCGRRSIFEGDELMPGRLADKVALITGGGTGIGAAIAHRFAAEGAAVLVTGRRPEPIKAVSEAIGGVAVAGDTNDNNHVATAVSTAVARFGGLDIVVTCAGIIFSDEVLSAKDNEWQQMMDINLTGAMKVARAALPALLERGGGAIVNVSSVGGLAASPQSVSYGVSKAGMLALTRSMAYDYGPHNIRVNTLCPGWVRTPMSEHEMDFLAGQKGISRAEAFKLVTAHLPLRRAAEPEEIANCCLFLASDEASFVTGAVLVADGGGAIVDVGTLAFVEGG